MAKDKKNAPEKPVKKTGGSLLPLIATFLLFVPVACYLVKNALVEQVPALAYMLPVFSAVLICLFWLKKSLLTMLCSLAAFVVLAVTVIPVHGFTELLVLLPLLAYLGAAVLALLWYLFLTKEVRAAKKAEKEAKAKAKAEAEAEKARLAEEERKEKERKEEEDRKEKLAKLEEKFNKGDITRMDYDEKKKKILGIKDKD